MKIDNQHWIYICSDSVGETAQAVAKATLRQFQMEEIKLKRFSQLQYEEEVRAIVQEAASTQALIIYTLVQPELREMMRLEAALYNVQAVDIMGPAMKGFVHTFHDPPRRSPELPHMMDQDYYRRIDAIEYAVRNDDGKSLTELMHADIVLIGVSRTSKTPLSIYLAHKGYKTANIPIVPEVQPPDILQHIEPKRIIGLTMKAEQLVRIREARLKDLGLTSGAKYAEHARVELELQHAQQFMERIGCTMIDVTDRAIEETSEIIIEFLQQ
ncbi:MULTISPECIES: pyruvate, water dikinase regulatory protein [Paenibacillus]|uniref:pyruvate, water dikinase regulatory protein n=1 Tax=Paenibacillus TaxID=44249 RepID=UPI00203B3C1A|nr:pyruvate, water dikinase regulatory protein [Paenibacillus camelliae]MCM3632750.1 kinase/pyrophosphorylase [Paenibacillus camelliae]